MVWVQLVCVCVYERELETECVCLRVLVRTYFCHQLWAVVGVVGRNGGAMPCVYVD